MDQNAYDRGIVSLGNLNRFARVMKKAAAKEPVTVVFLGGSITQDSHATKHENCYAYRTYLWWKEKFPETEITYVNAGIGATTSQFGAARVESDVLSRKPDVVFCEFSVNDDNNDFFKETFEGLVRRILLSETKPALFITNNARYDDGTTAQEVHNEIAMHYELPIVSVKDSIYEEILLGNLDRNTISTDMLHPNDLGHEYLAGLITNCLQLIYDKIFTDGVQDPEDIVPDPVTKNRYEHSVRIQQNGQIIDCRGFAADTEKQWGVRDIFKNGFIANEKGATITFLCSASKISIQFRKTIHHPAPVAAVYVDDREAAVLDANFDETWGDFLCLQDITESDKRENHKVTVTVTDFPEASETGFYLVSLILA